MATFLYEVQMLPDLNTKSFAAYFNNLPVDLHYGNSRRRYSRLSSSSEKSSLLEPRALVQSGEVNQPMAGVERNIPGLENDLIEMEEFQNLVATFIKCSKINRPVMEIGIYQIRTVANWREKGQPSPEGICKDGFEVVGIFCVKRESVVGGETQLYESKEQPPLLTRLLMPGELLTFNDRDFFHLTTPIFSTGEGMRDVFVFTV